LQGIYDALADSSLTGNIWLPANLTSGGRGLSAQCTLHLRKASWVAERKFVCFSEIYGDVTMDYTLRDKISPRTQMRIPQNPKLSPGT
jgi:hypothetical protein